jgi:hypothetical protein
LRAYGGCRVSCVQCLSGGVDPWRMYVETVQRGRAKKSVLYRIKITLKSGKPI